MLNQEEMNIYLKITVKKKIRHTDQWSRIKNVEINHTPTVNKPLTKEAIIHMEKRQSLQQGMLGKLDSHM